MPTLRIRNLTPRRLVFDRVVGAVAPDSTKDVDIDVSQIEFLRPSLVKMRDAGLIEFNHFNVDDDGDDDTEFVTLEDIKFRIANAIGGGPGSGNGTAGTQPLTGIVNGANQTFTSVTKWIRNANTAETLFYNGVRLTEGAGNDYIASESVPTTGYDTVTLAFAPQPGDVLVIDFYPI